MSFIPLLQGVPAEFALYESILRWDIALVYLVALMGNKSLVGCSRKPVLLWNDEQSLQDASA
jgi:hypothetical protein